MLKQGESVNDLADSVVLVFWEDVSSVRGRPLNAGPERSHRVTVGILADVQPEYLRIVMDTELPHTGEGQWETYPRGVIQRVLHVKSGKHLNWRSLRKKVATLSTP